MSGSDMSANTVVSRNIGNVHLNMKTRLNSRLIMYLTYSLSSTPGFIETVSRKLTVQVG